MNYKWKMKKLKDQLNRTLKVCSDYDVMLNAQRLMHLKYESAAENLIKTLQDENKSLNKHIELLKINNNLLKSINDINEVYRMEKNDNKDFCKRYIYSISINIILLTGIIIYVLS
jgi:hypothetical protein